MQHVRITSSIVSGRGPLLETQLGKTRLDQRAGAIERLRYTRVLRRMCRREPVQQHHRGHQSRAAGLEQTLAEQLDDGRLRVERRSAVGHRGRRVR